MDLRKMLMIATIAGAAALAPTAAVADDYPEDEDVTQCDLSDISPGLTFECVVSDDEGETAGMFGSFTGEGQLGIAGATATVTKALVDGSASFDISLPDSVGTLSLTTLVDGVAVDSVTVEVAEDGTVTTSSGGAATDAGDALSQTGFSNGPLAIGVVVLLAAGGGAVLVAARRSRQS